MRIRHLIAAVVSVSYALLLTSCLQSPTAAQEIDPGEAQSSNGTEPIGESLQESGKAYESKDFPFVVVVKDDGEDRAGGWQATEKTFHFVERNLLIPVYRWKCRIRIEVPIRSQLWGPISPSRAALYSAEVANEVVDPLLESRPAWKNLGAEFCLELRAGMDATFKERYRKLGARVLLNQ